MKSLAVFAVLAALLLVSTTYASAATLWDFMIIAGFKNSQIELNDKPVINGTVLNQASKPVPGAEVKIRFGGVSASTTTDEQGKFSYEFAQQSTPGLFSVTIFATKDNLKGFSTTTLKVGSEYSTFDEIYYNQLAQNKTKPASTPYEILKLKNYEKFLAQQNKKLQKQIDIEAKKLALSEKRDLARQRLEQTLQERPVGGGVYEGTQYEDYISKLNPRVKDAIVNQLSFTKQLQEEAKQAMKEVLDNGGSLQEARKVYFEKLSLTKEELIKVNEQNNTESHSKIKKTEDKKINSKKVKGLKLNKYLK